jgi:hypothetical protein
MPSTWRCQGCCFTILAIDKPPRAIYYIECRYIGA